MPDVSEALKVERESIEAQRRIGLQWEFVERSDEWINAEFGDPNWGFDGIWSKQTKELAARKDVLNIQLDIHWANRPQSWRCPSCERPKADIAHMGKDGVLVMSLCEHHDHGVNYLSDWGKARNAPPFYQQSKELGQYVERHIRPLAQRFRPVVICGECNNADGHAKTALNIDPWFSFAPAEIGGFIRLGNDRSHTLDLNVARGIWERVRPLHEERLRTLAALLERAESQRHLYVFEDGFAAEYASSRAFRRPPEFDLAAIAKRLDVAVHWLKQRLHERSISEGGRIEASAKRRKRANAAPQKPTREEFEKYHPVGVLRQEAWSRLPACWRCPICARDSYEIMRKSARGWTREVFVREHRTLENKWTQGPTVFICQDCLELPQIMRSSEHGDLVDHLLIYVDGEITNYPEVVSRLIDEAPHRRHNLRPDWHVFIGEIRDRLEGECDIASDFESRRWEMEALYGSDEANWPSDWRTMEIW
jgi:rubredoxin